MTVFSSHLCLELSVMSLACYLWIKGLSGGRWALNARLTTSCWGLIHPFNMFFFPQCFFPPQLLEEKNPYPQNNISLLAAVIANWLLCVNSSGQEGSVLKLSHRVAKANGIIVQYSFISLGLAVGHDLRTSVWARETELAKWWEVKPALISSVHLSYCFLFRLTKI